MRIEAIVYERYGGPEVLRLAEIEQSAPASDGVLVRVMAASTNPLDWHFMRGEPYLIRLIAGLGSPRQPRLGTDVAGMVEAVGSKVCGLRPGDAVFGAARGAFGQYVCAAAKNLARMPGNLSFEQAAAMPIAAVTALQALCDKGRLKAGQKVLINGASGGVGSFAVQIAAGMGGVVTAVTSARNVEWVQALGAVQVIDYTREDFTRSAASFDLLLDCVGNRTTRDCLRVVRRGGTMVGVGGRPGKWFTPLPGLVRGAVLGPLAGRRIVNMLAHVETADLETLAALVKAGKLRPMIDRSYPLAETPEAIRYLEQGHARGKVTIRVADGE